MVQPQPVAAHHTDDFKRCGVGHDVQERTVQRGEFRKVEPIRAVLVLNDTVGACAVNNLVHVLDE